MAEAQQSCADTKPKPNSRVWDTDAVEGREAFDYYREAICAAFMPLRPEIDQEARSRFSARVESLELPSGTLNIVSAAPHLVCRGRREIAASPFECYYLNYQTAGTCRIFQNGSEVVLRRGDVGLFDGAADFDLEHGTDEPLGVSSLMIPKEDLHDAIGCETLEIPKLVSRHPTFGQLTAQAAMTLSHAIHATPQSDCAKLAAVFVTLAAMSAPAEDAKTGSAGRGLAQLARLRQIIRQNCSSPGFCVSDCAALAGLSVGYVHQLFARQGDRFGACLKRERIRLASSRLADHRYRHLPIASIAYAVGFKDLSHFGRCFRQETGLTPGQWRNDHPRNEG